jgi:hypothetical protein
MDFVKVLKKCRQAHLISQTKQGSKIKILTRPGRLFFTKKAYEIAILDGFSYRQNLPSRVQFGQ